MGKTSCLALLLLVGISFGGCSPEMTPAEKEVREKRWIYESMRKWYLWQDNVPKSFDKTAQELDLTAYFNSFLYLKGDQTNGDIYSRMALNPDYKNSKSTGDRYNTVDFGFKYIGFDLLYEVVFLVVHVYPGSPADGILQRGDIIYKVNDQKVTQYNYSGVFDSPTIRVALADYNMSKATPNGEVYELSKGSFSKDPIFDCRVIDDDGRKVGYLAFGSFDANCKDDLSDAFGTMRDGGATELILDLRYNPGGYVDIANYLASLIAPSSASGELFLQMTPNEKISSSNIRLKYYLLRDNDKIKAKKLELSRLVVLTSFMTASASETLIHCLRPYMEVMVIGSDTEGKNKAAVELIDDSHQWMLMPLFSVVSDKNGETFATSGLDTNVPALESPGQHIFGLGDSREKLLSIALSYLRGDGVQSNGLSRSSGNCVALPMDHGGGNLVKVDE